MKKIYGLINRKQFSFYIMLFSAYMLLIYWYKYIFGNNIFIYISIGFLVLSLLFLIGKRINDIGKYRIFLWILFFTPFLVPLGIILFQFLNIDFTNYYLLSILSIIPPLLGILILLRKKGNSKEEGFNVWLLKHNIFCEVNPL